MATPDSRPAPPSELDASNLVVGVVSARWNNEIVDRLTAGAHRAIGATGAIAHIASAPGAFELPFVARTLIESGDVDAVVVLGAVIRGETTHYEIVSQGCAQGIMQVQIATGIPIGMGILTVENMNQALARSEPAGGHNVGEEATFAAIEMALLAGRTRASRPE
ncbi:6,7-dimethyl-8-ribityllumazine synthase [Ilumatobacter sp.]|uniref:6,7-dimethyl-8-ribityllumazine synthase n=1 Tax=Ilumatobacter sp. TaxID=1967498 RepID=UPI00375392D4